MVFFGAEALFVAKAPGGGTLAFASTSRPPASRLYGRRETPGATSAATSFSDRDGINAGIECQDVKLSVGILREAGDVFGLLQKRSVFGHFAVLVAQPPNGAKVVISVKVNALQ